MNRRRLLAAATAAAVLPLSRIGVAASAPGSDAALGRPASGPGTAGAPALESGRLDRLADAARASERLHALVVMQAGEVVFAEAFRGPPPERAVNVKSVSKSLVAALVGCALEREVLAGGVAEGVGIALGEAAPALVPPGADPRVARLTLEDLLTMRAGLERTSGRAYGAWTASEDWVRHVLTRPFVTEPGTRMLYSTGDWHVLGAVLTGLAGSNLHSLANRWLGDPLDIDFAPWTRDPQGRYLGGNEMSMSPLEMARFGELYRRGGEWRGRRVFDADWARASFTPRTRSPWSGDAYGYGWFLRDMGGVPAAYARGYGGQMIHVVPERELVVAMTSDTTRAARSDGYVGELHALVERHLLAR